MFYGTKYALGSGRSSGPLVYENFGEGGGSGLTRNLLEFWCRKTSRVPFFFFCLSPHVPSLCPLGSLLGQAKDSRAAQGKDCLEHCLLLWKPFPLWLLLWAPTSPCRGQIGSAPCLATTAILHKGGIIPRSRSNLETPKMLSLPFA